MSETKIVCLVGSTKFKDAFTEANRNETLKGHIVLSVGLFGHQEDDFVMNSKVKRSLDKLHIRKIDLCDEILVLNCDDYIGVGGCDEIGYAWSIGKPVRYLESRMEFITNSPAFPEMLKRFDLKLDDFTCRTCIDNKDCEYVMDPYNTNGDCLAMK